MAIKIIKVGSNYDAGTLYKEFQVTNRDDVVSLSTSCAPGSKAYPADRSFLFVLSNEATWVESVIYWDWGTV
mgnify:CR=1 FL=1